MATLHFICGKAGAGKTTLARELGRTLPAVVICEDEWISTLGFEVHSLEDYLNAASRCRGVIGPLASRLLQLGVSVVFDFAGNTAKGWQLGAFRLRGGSGRPPAARHRGEWPSAWPTFIGAMKKNRPASTGATSTTSSSTR